MSRATHDARRALELDPRRILCPPERDPSVRDAMLALVTDATDPPGPGEAWERLATAGYVPESWVGDPDRIFDCPACDASCDRDGAMGPCLCDAACCVCIGRAAPRPPEAGAALALARDPSAILAAEELARDAAERLRVWGFAGAPTRRVAWSVGHARDVCAEASYGLAPLVATLLAVLPARGYGQWSGNEPAIERAAAAIPASPLRELFRGMARAREAYATVVGADERIDCGRAADWTRASQVVGELGLIGRRWRELPDPLGPLMGIWALGFVPRFFWSGGVVRLWAPFPAWWTWRRARSVRNR